MADWRSIDELKAACAGSPAPEGVVALYRKAFKEYGARALWSSKPAPHPTAADALASPKEMGIAGT